MRDVPRGAARVGHSHYSSGASNSSCSCGGAYRRLEYKVPNPNSAVGGVLVSYSSERCMDCRRFKDGSAGACKPVTVCRGLAQRPTPPQSAQFAPIKPDSCRADLASMYWLAWARAG